MERFVGFSANEVIRKSSQANFIFDRQTKGSHEIWWNSKTRARTTVPHHLGDFFKETLYAILHQAKLNIDEFLKS